MLQEILEAVAPHLIELFMALVSLATGYALVLIKRYTGIQIEEKHRLALHSAIRTGVLAMASNGLQGQALVDAVKDYVRASVPDALAYFVPGDGVLSTLIKSKIKDILT